MRKFREVLQTGSSNEIFLFLEDIQVGSGTPNLWQLRAQELMRLLSEVLVHKRSQGEGIVDQTFSDVLELENLLEIKDCKNDIENYLRSLPGYSKGTYKSLVDAHGFNCMEVVGVLRRAGVVLK